MNIFIQNKYTTWYFNIINKAKFECRVKSKDQYYEAHHIIPNSIIKNKNTVLLTAREHFVCHVLLCKMCENKQHKSKMYFALKCISEVHNEPQKKVRYINSKLYAQIKPKIAETISKSNKNRTSPLKGTKLSEEFKTKLREAFSKSEKKKLSSIANFKIGSEKNKGKKRPEHIREICRQNGLKKRTAKGKLNMKTSAIENSKIRFSCKYCHKEMSKSGIGSHFNNCQLYKKFGQKF